MSDDEKEQQRRLERILARRQERLGVSREEASRPAAEPSPFLEIEELRLRETGCGRDELLRRDLEEIRDTPYPGPDCLTPDEVVIHAETRKLPADRLAHARQCIECCALLTMAERRPPGLLREPPAVEAPRRWWWVQPGWSPALAAACLLLAIGLFQLVWRAIPTPNHPIYAKSFVLLARSGEDRLANEARRSINGGCFLALAAILSPEPGELRATLNTLLQAERLSLTAADRDLSAMTADRRQALARSLGSNSLVRCEGEVVPQGISLKVEIAQGTELERQSFTAAGMTAIPDLARQAGEWALAKLGREDTPLREAGYAIPTDAAAFHEAAVGVSYLADHQPALARQSLKEALKHEENPLVYAALADSFVQLGNTKSARASLLAAVQQAARYPLSERQALKARYSVASAQWNDAIEVYSSLEKSSPNPFESALQVAAAHLATANAKEALDKIAETRKSPLAALDTARLDLLEARAADILGDPERQLRTALAAAETAQMLGARSLEAEANLLAGRASRTRALPGDREKSARLFQHALDLARVSRDENARASALLEQGILTFLNKGATTEVEERLREALEIYREQGNDGGMATVEVRLGHLKERHNPQVALQHYEHALQTFKGLGNQRGIAEALLSRGVLHWTHSRNLEDLANADRDFDAALKTFRTISDRGGEARVLADRGQLLLERGRVVEARQELEKCLDIRERNGLRRDEAASHAVLAQTLLVADDLAGAEAHLDNALDLYEEISGDDVRRSPKAAEARLWRAMVWLEKGELDKAEAELGDLLDLSHQETLPEQDVQLALAQLHLLRGDAARAEIALKKAGTGENQMRLAAQVDLARGRRDEGLMELRQLAQNARDRGHVLIELEAQFSFAEARLTDQRQEARAELQKIADRANALGAKGLARKAESLLQPQGGLPLSNRILSALSSLSSRF